MESIFTEKFYLPMLKTDKTLPATLRNFNPLKTIFNFEPNFAMAVLLRNVLADPCVNPISFLAFGEALRRGSRSVAFSAL